jgi:hypothetical protein
MENISTAKSAQIPWNRGKLTGQKPPLKLKKIWAIRVRLQLTKQTRELAMFNLAIDSKLRGCDLVALRVLDVTHGAQIAPRAIVMQRKTVISSRLGQSHGFGLTPIPDLTERYLNCVMKKAVR